MSHGGKKTRYTYVMNRSCDKRNLITFQLDTKTWQESPMHQTYFLFFPRPFNYTRMRTRRKIRLVKRERVWHHRLVQNNRNSVISNQIAEQPIITFQHYVTSRSICTYYTYYMHVCIVSKNCFLVVLTQRE